MDILSGLRKLLTHCGRGTTDSLAIERLQGFGDSDCFVPDCTGPPSFLYLSFSIYLICDSVTSSPRLNCN